MEDLHKIVFENGIAEVRRISDGHPVFRAHCKFDENNQIVNFIDADDAEEWIKSNCGYRLEESLSQENTSTNVTVE
jgi:hypothetical protein